MRAGVTLVWLAALALLAGAAHVHRVSLTATPFGAHEQWVDRGRAAADAPCRVDIVLPLRNHALIDEHVRAISDPAYGSSSSSSSNVGSAHWDVRRIGALASADESDVRAVLDWIASVDGAGELDVHVHSVRSFVRVRGPVRAIERLFGCEMHRFEHPLARGHVVLRAHGAYALPSAIHARIALLAGLDDYPVVPAEPLLFRPRPVDGRRAAAVERRADAHSSSAAAMMCDAGREALDGRRDEGRGAARSLPPGSDGTPRGVWPVGLSERELAAGADVFAGPSSASASASAAAAAASASEMLVQLVCGSSEHGLLRVFIPALDADVVRRGDASLRVSFAHCRPSPGDAHADSAADGDADGACSSLSSMQLAVDTLSACRRVGRAGSALVCEYDVPTPLFQHTRVRVALAVAGSGVGAARDIVAASVVDCAFPGVLSTPAHSAQLYHVPDAGAACAVYEHGVCRLGGPDDLGVVLVPAHAGSACDDGETCALAPETALAVLGMRALGEGVDRYLALHGRAAPQRALDDGRETKRVTVRAAAGASVQLAAGAAGARGVAPMVVVPDASVSSQVQILVDLLDDPNAPLVLVLSWSVCEHAPGVAAANDVLRLLALTNHTIVAPSGDLGFAGCGDVHVCRTGADGHADARTRCANAALFPASSPYVLAVGGTQLSDASTPFEAKQRAARQPTAASSAYTGEVVASLASGAAASSGGGFSRLFEAQPHQRQHLAAYVRQAARVHALGLARMPHNESVMGPARRGLRGYPDVALLAHNHHAIFGEDGVQVDGTMASASLMGGFLATANVERRARGLAPLGFVNPLLYRTALTHPGVFRDIVVGTNEVSKACASPTAPCCDEVFFCSEGVHAVPGWDPVSGLGGVLVEELLRATSDANSAPPRVPAASDTHQASIGGDTLRAAGALLDAASVRLALAAGGRYDASTLAVTVGVLAVGALLVAARRWLVGGSRARGSR